MASVFYLLLLADGQDGEAFACSADVVWEFAVGW